MDNSLISCESFLSDEDLSQGGVDVRSRTISSRTKRSGSVNRSDVFANEMMTSFRITRRSTLTPEDLMRQSSQTTGVPLRRLNSTNSSSSIHQAANTSFMSEGAYSCSNDIPQNTLHEMMNASTASLALEDLCMNLNKSLELSTGQDSFNSISSRPLHRICEKGNGLRGGGENGSSGSEEPSVSSVKDVHTSDDENAVSDLDRHSSWQRRIAVFRVSCGNFVNSTPIQIFMSFLLVSNGIVLGALTFDTLPPDTRRILEYTDIITLIAFTIEITLHGIYLGLRQLFKDGWLTFDLFVILFSWCFEGSSISVLRGFRIFRVFSVISRFENLKTLFEAIGSTIPRMASIWLSLLLCKFNYVSLVYS
jgi:Ion transport protein